MLVVGHIPVTSDKRCELIKKKNVKFEMCFLSSDMLQMYPYALILCPLLELGGLIMAYWAKLHYVLKGKTQLHDCGLALAMPCQLLLCIV